MAKAATKVDLAEKSKHIRRETMKMVHRARSGHLGSSFSIIDILTVLYSQYLNVDPKKPDDPKRDRFILSKGHGCSALYVTLAEQGFFPTEQLETYMQDGSTFAGHPCSDLVPGIEVSTGSLGHGLPIGSGMALAAKRDSQSYRTVVLISDGECDEGTTWEAALAANQWGLGNLTCIIDYNKIQSFGRVSEVMELEPLGAKWEAFGWNVQEVNGHNHQQIIQALEQDSDSNTPRVIIAHTVKGKGVSFMEDTVDWHYWTPSDEHCAQALSELK